MGASNQTLSFTSLVEINFIEPGEGGLGPSRTLLINKIMDKAGPSVGLNISKNSPQTSPETYFLKTREVSIGPDYSEVYLAPLSIGPEGSNVVLIAGNGAGPETTLSGSIISPQKIIHWGDSASLGYGDILFVGIDNSSAEIIPADSGSIYSFSGGRAETEESTVINLTESQSSKYVVRTDGGVCIANLPASTKDGIGYNFVAISGTVLINPQDDSSLIYNVGTTLPVGDYLSVTSGIVSVQSNVDGNWNVISWYGTVVSE